MLKGTHCQSSTYQSYQPSSFCVNSSPQSINHQYSNRNTHQMQSGMSYSSSHHASTYVSSQSQYGTMNQAVYGNSQSSYTNDNPSVQQVKPVWGTCGNSNGSSNGNSTEVMQPYCQPTHSPLVNPAHCMPSMPMRSPPHEIMNTAPASPTSHCYRQGPVPPSSSQSAHSWAHSQIPGSLMFRSSCTASPVSNHAHSSNNCQSFMPSATSSVSELSAAVVSQSHQPEASAHLTVTDSSSSVRDTAVGQEISSLQPLQSINIIDSKTESSLMVHPRYNIPCSTVQTPVHVMSTSHHSCVEQHQHESNDTSYPTYYNLDQSNMCSSPNSLSNLSSVVGSASSTLDNSENSSAVGSNLPLEEALNGSLNDCSIPNNKDKCEVSFTSDLNKVNDDPKLHLEETDRSGASTEIADAKLADNCSVKKNLDENSTEAEHNKAENVLSVLTSETDKNQLEKEKEDTSNLPQDDSEQKEIKIKCIGDTKRKNKFVNSVTNGSLESECDTSLTDSIPSHLDATTCDEVQYEQPKSDIRSETLDKVKSEPCEGLKHNLRRRKCAVSYQETPPEWDSKFVFGINETSTPRNKHSSVRLSDRRKKNKSGELASNVQPTNENPVKKEPEGSESIEQNNLSVSTFKQSSLSSDQCSETKSIPSDHIFDEKIDCDEQNSLVIETPLQPRKDEHHSPPQIIVLSPALPRKMGTSKPATVPEEKNVPQGRGSNKKQPSKKRPCRSSFSEGNPDSVQKKKGKPSSSRNSRSKSQADKKKKASKKKKPQKKAASLEINESVKVKKKPFIGPYIHITGTKARPLSVTVVNVPFKEVEKDVKYPKQKRDYNLGGNLRKRLHVGHTSTLSPFYDAFTKDKTWVCAFCHNGSHYCGLGDLYGPYYMSDDRTFIDQTSSLVTQTSSVDNTEERGVKIKEQKNVIGTSPTEETLASSRRIRSKRKRSELVEEFFKSTMSKKSKQIKKSNSQAPSAVDTTQVQPILPPLPQPTSLPHLSESNSFNSTNAKEFWVHEDCAIWSHGIYIMSQRIYGLEEAVKEASNMVCSKCKLSGATLGCWKKGCTEQYHFVCAKDRGCEMNEENLFVVCLKHQVLAAMMVHRSITEEALTL